MANTNSTLLMSRVTFGRALRRLRSEERRLPWPMSPGLSAVTSP